MIAEVNVKPYHFGWKTLAMPCDRQHHAYIEPWRLSWEGATFMPRFEMRCEEGCLCMLCPMLCPSGIPSVLAGASIICSLNTSQAKCREED